MNNANTSPAPRAARPSGLVPVLSRFRLLVYAIALTGCDQPLGELRCTLSVYMERSGLESSEFVALINKLDSLTVRVSNV